jgi:hypothetical protein
MRHINLSEGPRTIAAPPCNPVPATATILMLHKGAPLPARYTYRYEPHRHCFYCGTALGAICRWSCLVHPRTRCCRAVQCLWKLPNPLAPPYPLRAEGDHDRCPCLFFVDIGLFFSYTAILAPVKDVARRHTVSWERGRCPRAGLQPAPGRLGYHVSRHYDRGGRCIPGLGQAKAGNARADRVPGSLA